LKGKNTNENITTQNSQISNNSKPPSKSTTLGKNASTSKIKPQ